MSKRLIFASFIAAATSLMAAAQAQDTNPAHAPVFLDNHRPAKKGKAPTTRSVKGKVVDAFGQPLEGALVTLTDSKTNEKRTFITKRDGQYNFDDLSFTLDYQLQARYKDMQSESKKLSQYDHTPELVRILDIGGEAKPPQEPTAQATKQDSEPKR